MSSVRVRVNEGGRIVIPADYRRELGLKAGDTLLLERDGNTLMLSAPEAALDDAVAYVRARLNPGIGSLSESLIRDRRDEAARE